MSVTTSASGSVLIPTARQMKSYAVMRSLERQNIHTVIASEYEQIPHFSSKYCSERALLSASPDNLTAYKDALLEIASRPDIETIMPIRECDVFVFAKHWEEFQDTVSLVTPRLETLRKGHDRMQLSREAEKAGVPQARTRLLSEVDNWDSDVVIKSRYNILTSEYVDSVSQSDIGEVRSVRFLRAGQRPDKEAIRKEMKHEPIVQDYIQESDRYLYCALLDHGTPLASCQHKQIRGNSWVGGGGVYRVSAYSSEVEDVATRLLSHLNWHGLVCIEYTRDKQTGEWKFLEINPRIWQSVPSSVCANADFPYYYWLHARGEPEKIDESYKTGIGTHMPYGEITHLLSTLRDESPFLERPSFVKTLWEIASSCITDPRLDYMHLDDPQFFANAIRNALSAEDSEGQRYSNGDITSP